jgi:hypothetical protein
MSNDPTNGSLTNGTSKGYPINAFNPIPIKQGSLKKECTVRRVVEKAHKMAQYRDTGRMNAWNW